MLVAFLQTLDVLNHRMEQRKDVDGPVKPGHDEMGRELSKRLALGKERLTLKKIVMARLDRAMNESWPHEAVST